MSLAETWDDTRPVGALTGALVQFRTAHSPAWPLPSGSLAVMPGQAATPEVVGREKTRQDLIALVHRVAVYGLSWTAEQPSKITAATRQIAEAFLRALPAGKALPKISPDGEGRLIMAWEMTDGPLLMTVDDLSLHAVIAAGTPNAEYIDDMPFDPLEPISQKILDSIPPC
jgi:hypothetical protein